MKKHSHLFQWHRPTAGLATFIKLKSALLQLGNGTATGFCDLIRKEAEILLLPVSVYDFPDEYIRLGFGRENFQEGLKAFDQSLDIKKLAK